MAKEILNLEVKTNIKGAVTEVDNLGKSVQTAGGDYKQLTETIKKLETELARLNTIAAALPKKITAEQYNEYVALSSSIKKTTKELNKNKAALKKIQLAHKGTNKEIKLSTAAQKKNTNAAIRGIQHFRIMGVSIRKLKFMVRGVIPMFKLLFTTIKSGIASTGIGLLILALISIGTSMKSSVAGGKAFKAMMEGIGVVTGAITDALAFLGDLMLSVFGFDSSTDAAVVAAQNLEQAYKDLNEEMGKTAKQEAAAGVQKLKNKKIIDDTTRSEKERLAAATENFVIDSVHLKHKLEQSERQLKLDEDAVRLGYIKIIQAGKDVELLKEAQDELDNLAETQNKNAINNSNLLGNEFKLEEDFNKKKKDIRSVNRKAEKKASADQAKADALNSREKLRQIEKEKVALQELIDLETDRVNNQIIDSAKLLDDFYDSQLKAQDREKNAIIDKWNFAIQAEEEGSADRIALQEAMNTELAAIDKKYTENVIENLTNQQKWDEMTTDQKLAYSAKGMGVLSQQLGEQTEAGKAAAIVQAGIQTYLGATNAYSSLALIPYVGPVLGGIAAAAAISMGLKNIAAIKSGGTGGGGSASLPTTSAAPPSPQMMSGAFELTGGQPVEPLQAYVVSDDITDSQNGLAIIRRRATI
tara:strand:+ start:43 stop:1971 length:1929 start_codon:yes stop_codon:yes gene_type:complete